MRELMHVFASFVPGPDLAMPTMGLLVLLIWALLARALLRG